MAEPARDVLAEIAAVRIRSFAPVVLGAQIVSFALSELAGVPLMLSAVVYNIVAIGLAALIWRRVRTDSLGHRVHLALAALWCIPVGGTFVSALGNHDPRLTVLVVIELVCIAILVHSTWALACAAAGLALFIPIVLHVAPSDAPSIISSLVTAATFGFVLQNVVRRALLRADAHRHAQADLARELARRVEEVETSNRERAELQDRLLHAQRLEAMATMAGGFAHDMNNVLAAITSYAQTAPTEEPADARLVQSIVDQAARAAELTRSVLAFTTRGQYRKQPVRFVDVLGDVVPLIERTLPSSCVVETRTVHADVVLDVDRVQLGQALVNLCNNAGDAMPDGGRILISSGRTDLDAAAARSLGVEPGRYVRIEVADTGTGMDAETRKRVFEPFFTTKARGAGTGLGLAMVWGVVHGHAGAIGVDSELSRGTRFTIWLPEAVALPVPLPSRTPAANVATPAILVVDDEPAVRNGTSRILTRRGYRVLTAANGAEALDVFAKHAGDIALVILDMGMPVMGGAECFQRLRERSSVPVLVMTGYAIDAELQDMLARGAGLLEKPYALNDLLAEVAKLLPDAAGLAPRVSARRLS